MMKSPKKVCELLNIKYPIIQAGMVWASGAKLAAACANADILGVIGAGSMKPELLDEQIKKAKLLAPGKSIGVNIPLLYSRVEEQISVALDNDIKIFITSAGSPKKWTSYLKDKDATVIHVTSSPELAKKCELAGVDMIVAEGFEAGGHNGRDETTTLALIPQVVDAVDLPVIAAGGIGDGRGIAAVMALGAAGAQLGTRFLMSQESSAHQNFKTLLQSSGPGDTTLTLKQLVPVRLIKNKFYESVLAAESAGAGQAELSEVLGKGRARKGILEGDLDEGELEIGQICGLLNDLPPAKEIVENLIQEYEKAINSLNIFN